MRGSRLFGNIFKTSIFIIIIVLAVYLYKNGSFANIAPAISNVKYVTNLNNLSKPQQSPAAGNVKREIDGVKINIKYVAKYTIRGRVVHTMGHFANDVSGKLMPKDVGISWGFLASEENKDKLTWFLGGDRILACNTSNTVWLAEHGGFDKVGLYFSNNHLIYSDNRTKSLINKIRVNDFIEIQGYLVDVVFDYGIGRNSTMKTSTVRNDTGQGACETIYVTNVSWLKQSKYNK